MLIEPFDGAAREASLVTDPETGRTCIDLEGHLISPRESTVDYIRLVDATDAEEDDLRRAGFGRLVDARHR